MTNEERQKVYAVIKGLLQVAKIAMPDTYYQSDSRINRARKWLQSQNLKEPVFR